MFRNVSNKTESFVDILYEIYLIAFLSRIIIIFIY